MKKLLRALAGPFVDLIKSESGEFMTTREKSRLLDAMMREQRETNRAKAVVKLASNEPSLTTRHIQSA
jgi:hypothetical protein